MKLFRIHKRFLLMLNAIAILVAFLMHLPELIALSDPVSGSSLFPDVHWVNVSYEILFTYLSILLLFFLNIRMMMPDNPVRELGWKRVAVTFVVTLIVCNLLGKGFVYVHQHFEVPAITAMLLHYLHPLRDILIACIVTGTCYLDYPQELLQRKVPPMAVQMLYRRRKGPHQQSTCPCFQGMVLIIGGKQCFFGTNAYLCRQTIKLKK